jgi:CheY-like chemotaxis protein
MVFALSMLQNLFSYVGWGFTMKLLLVEDNVESAALLVRLFENTGYDVVHKTHGLEGLKAAREEKFDAILLDFNLPDIDGSQVGLLLRPSQKKVPIIALTSHTDKSTRNKAKVFGFNAFIPKPWSVVDLMNILQTLTEAEDINEKGFIEIVETKLTTQEIKAISSPNANPKIEN